MTLSIDLLEAIWIALTLTTLALTLSAYVDAKADARAVKLLNGKARELSATGTVRRERFRVLIQLLLVAIVAPGIFDPSPVPPWYFVIILMSIPVVLLTASVKDAADRRAMTVLVTADLLEERTTALDEIKAAILENTVVTHEAVDAAQAAAGDAKKAYHEANSVNLKIAKQGEALVAQGVQLAAQGDGHRLDATMEDTHTKVGDLHDALESG